VRARSTFELLFLGCSMLTACGGETSSGGVFHQADAGDASPGGAPGSGGAGTGGLGAGGATSSGGAVGSGGALGSGGAITASGGSGGSGGSTLDASPCAPPTSANDTALCVTFAPEAITARTEAALDKRGVLIVQVFDTATPPEKNSDQVALANQVLPANAATGGEISVDALPEVRLEGAFPATSYVRVFFVDNPRVFAAGGGIDYGVWLGGVNLADGVKKGEPLSPVSLTQGAGNALNVSLTALRRLDVVASASAKPVGDGQGTLTVTMVNNPDPSKNPAAFGIATKRCADVSSGAVDFSGFFFGKGPYWAAGVLNDLGKPGDLPAGALATLDLTPAGPRIPKEIEVGARDYATTIAVDLNYVNPLSADAGPPGPNSCADLGLVGDGGP